MISYHPAFDPYHTAFRLVRLLTADPRGYEESKARILDFHLVFPEAIQHITLPQRLVGWRRKSQLFANQYWFNGDRWMVFIRMKPFFDAATSLLYGSHVLDRTAYAEGLLRLDTSQETTARLTLAAMGRNEAEADLTTFVAHGLGSIPLIGRDGLKDRTGLMEFKYDSV